MQATDPTILPTPELERQVRWHAFALKTVWIGVAIALLAAVYRYGSGAEFPVPTFVMALLALAASYPVWLAARRLRRERARRAEG